MTVYDTLSSSGGDWFDSASWTNGSVPDSPDDGVILDVPGGQAWMTSTPIYPNLSATVASLNIFSGNSLIMSQASLTVAGNLTVNAGGAIDIGGDSIAAGSFINSGTLSGIGHIAADGLFENYGTIESQPFDELSGAAGIAVCSRTFYNVGTIDVADGSRMLVDPSGGFLNYSQGELSQGIYDVAGGGYLTLDMPGAVTHLAATVILDDGNGDFAPSFISGDGVTLQQSLTSIAPSGELQVIGGLYQTGNTLTLDGTLALSGGATLSAGALTIGNHGLLTYSGQAAGAAVTLGVGAIANDGVIVVEPGSELILDALGGDGAVVDGAGGVLRLTGPASNDLVFEGSGVAVFDQPKAYSGYIEQFAAGDTLQLTGLTLSSVIGYSYDTTSTSGTGELTIRLTDGSSVELNFAGGGYATGSFTLGNGQGSTPDLIVAETGAAGSATYAANVAVQSFQTGVLSGRVSVADSPTQIATWLDGLEKVAMGGHLQSIELSNDGTLTITRQQAAQDADALNDLVGPHQIQIVGTSAHMA